MVGKRKTLNNSREKWFFSEEVIITSPLKKVHPKVIQCNMLGWEKHWENAMMLNYKLDIQVYANLSLKIIIKTL